MKTRRKIQTKSRIKGGMAMGILVTSLLMGSACPNVYAIDKESTIVVDVTKSEADVQRENIERLQEKIPDLTSSEALKAYKEVETKLKVFEEDYSTEGDAEALRYALNDVLHLIDMKALKENGIEEDVTVGTWMPEKVVKLPDKVSYTDGEEIDLNGMEIRFKCVKRGETSYEVKERTVPYSEIREGYKGWTLHLKTRVARYSESENGKMKIRFTMRFAEK